MVIRELKPSDSFIRYKMNRIIELYEMYMGNGIMDMETLEEITRSRATKTQTRRLFYIEIHDDIEAVAMTEVDEEGVGQLAFMVVDEGVRGRGYGDALINHRLLVLKDMGCKLVKVTSWRREKESSYNLMIKNGFKEIKTIEGLWENDHCVDCHPNKCTCSATFLELEL